MGRLQPLSRYECETFLNPRLPEPPVGWQFVRDPEGFAHGFVWDIEATKAREAERKGRGSG